MYVKQTFLDIFFFYHSSAIYKDKLYLPVYLINVNVKDIANL